MSLPPLVLVDGTNLLHAEAFRGGAPRLELAVLVDRIASWAAATGVDVLVAVDGIGPGVANEVTPQVTIAPSAPTDADSLLERRARECRDERRTWWLATDDLELRRAAGLGADRLFRSDEFAAELVASERAVVDRVEQDAGAPGRRLDQDLDPGTLDALERLRRGLQG